MCSTPQTTWTESNKSTVIAVLDRVISETGKRTFARLSNNLDNNQIAEKIDYGLSQNLLLSGQHMPDYNDEWVALFYFLWYQPKQITLACQLINWLLESGVHNKKIIYIIDYACGALATQFGLIFAMINILDQEETIGDIWIDCVDESESMLALGNSSWEIFNRKLPNFPDIIQKAVKKIKYHHTFSGEAAALFEPRNDLSVEHHIWLFMLHGLYAENVSDIGNHVSDILTDLRPKKPESILLTSESHKEHLMLDTVGRVVNESNLSLYRIDNPLNTTESKLIKTTEFRKHLARTYPNINRTALLGTDVTCGFSRRMNNPIIYQMR